MKYIKFYFLLVFLSFFSLLIAQSKAELAADKFIQKNDYKRAFSLLQEEHAKNPSNTKLLEKIANLYHLENPNSDETYQHLTKLYNSTGVSPTSKLKYAQVLVSKGEYDKASKIYNELAKARNPKGGKYEYSEDYFKAIAEENPLITIENCGMINTTQNDYSPVYYYDGLAFVSTSQSRKGTGFGNINENLEYFSDVFFSKKSDASSPTGFSKPTKLLRDFSQKYQQGPMSFTKDYGSMILTRSFYVDDKEKVKVASDNRTVNLKLYRVNYKKSSDNWAIINEMKLNGGSGKEPDFLIAHPALTQDDKKVIFSSNMEGGLGGTDLYIADYIDGNLGTPTNLGPGVNTPGDESFPYVDKNGDLYFASNGHPGLGGLDVFYSKKEGIAYKTVKNLGAPINSASDDFGLIANPEENSGYFSSNRSGGMGMDDIYYWQNMETELELKVISGKTKLPIEKAKIKSLCDDKEYETDKEGIVKIKVQRGSDCKYSIVQKGYGKAEFEVEQMDSKKSAIIPLDIEVDPFTKLTLKVIDNKTKMPIQDADVTLFQTSTGDEVGSKTDMNGILKVKGIKPNDLYNATASKINQDGSKYIAKSETINTTGVVPPQELEMTIELEKLAIDAVIRIDNIYYDLNKWYIRPDAANELNKVQQMLLSNPTMQIELSSHTDCRGTAQSNLDLSQKRAQAAVEYLVSRGIEPSRMIPRGYGENTPVNNCRCEGTYDTKCSEMEHQANRRTELRILRY